MHACAILSIYSYSTRSCQLNLSQEAHSGSIMPSYSTLPSFKSSSFSTELKGFVSTEGPVKSILVPYYSCYGVKLHE